MLVKMPMNAGILAIQPRQYEPDVPETLEHELEESKTVNVIRWRENTVTRKPESNARMVRWSDGSMTLHVGEEVLKVQTTATADRSTHLYTRHQKSNLECHGVVGARLLFQPASIHSNTHKALTRYIAKEHKKENRIKMVSTVRNPELQKREDERTWDEKNRLERKQQARRQRPERAPEFSADFLDAPDAGDLEGNLGAIKRGFKRAKNRPAGRARPRPPRASSKKNSDDESDDGDDEDDWDGGGRAAAAASEMEGFIVDDEDEDSDEFEELDSDDDEEEKPAKKARGGR